MPEGNGNGVVRLGADGEPLNESEKRLLGRILGDPGEFPGEFKSWIPNHLESNPPLLPFQELAFRRPKHLSQDSATAGQALTWSSANEQWEPGTPTVNPDDLGQAGAATGDLMVWDGSEWNDTIMGALSTGDMIQWNGTNWENTATGTLAAGDMLQWNGSDWEETTFTSIAADDGAVWDGTDWVNEPEPGKEIGYTEKTSNTTVTGTLTQILTLGAITYRAEPTIFEIGYSRSLVPGATGGNKLQFFLRDSTTNVAELAVWTNGLGAGSDFDWSGRHAVRFTPTAASHTYNIAVQRSNSNCTVYAGSGASGAEIPFWFRASYAGAG